MTQSSLLGGAEETKRRKLEENKRKKKNKENRRIVGHEAVEWEEGDRSDKSNNVVILRENSPFYKKMIFRHAMSCSLVPRCCVFIVKSYDLFFKHIVYKLTLSSGP